MLLCSLPPTQRIVVSCVMAIGELLDITILGMVIAAIIITYIRTYTTVTKLSYKYVNTQV
jgi:hypothetical protein